MKIAPPDKRNAVSARRLTLALAVVGLIPILLYGSAPSWWSQRDVLVQDANADDYAPVNQGQLKNIAKAATAELDAKLSGGAGDELHNLITSWSMSHPATNDFAPVNLGQLKNVARPFYDRLISSGIVDSYPWEASLNLPDDFAVANIGQVKSLFSFDIPVANLIQNPLGDRIAAGHLSANLALQAHAVWVWHDRFSSGSDFERNYPRRISELSSISSVSAGERHVLALRSDGTIWTWGENALGQLGDGTYTTRAVPAAVPGVSSIVSAKAGGLHTLALQQDGSLLAWGDNSYGQLGTGDTVGSATPKPVIGLQDVRKIAAGYQRSVALKNDGTVWTWGYDHYAGRDIFNSSPAAVPELSDAIDVAAGYEHTIAVKSDGTVWAWGSNYSNQIGNGNPWWKFQAIPAQVPNLSNIVKVASSYDHTLALTADGTVWAWGANSSGQLGDGTNQSRQAPVQVSALTNVIAIAASYSCSLAMKSDGTIWAWGDGSVGTVPGADLHVPQLVALGLMDTNQNGMDDRWETQFLGNMDQSGDDDFDGDGISNRKEFLRRTDPTDFFNGVAPVLEIAGGNNQIGDSGAFLNKPLKVRMRNQDGQIFVNAPVEFSVSSGSGMLAATLDGAQERSLLLRTDEKGEAAAYHALLGDGGTSTRTVASAGQSTALASAAFRSVIRFFLPPPPAPPPPDPNATPTATPAPTVPPVAPYRYAIIDLGKDAYPLRVNSKGWVFFSGFAADGSWGYFRGKAGAMQRLTYSGTHDSFSATDMNDEGVVVGSFRQIVPWIHNGENEIAGGLIWPTGRSDAIKISAPLAARAWDFNRTGTIRWCFFTAIDNENNIYGAVRTSGGYGLNFRTFDIFNAYAWGGGLSGQLSFGTATFAGHPYPTPDAFVLSGDIDRITRANGHGHYIGSKLALLRVGSGHPPILEGISSGMIDGHAVDFHPHDINDGGIVVGSAGSDMIVYSSPISRATFSGATPIAINDHTYPAPHASPGAGPQPTPIPAPQILGWAAAAQVIWERQPDGETWHPFGLEEMIPSMDGWQYLEPYDINDSGAITGRGWYTDPSIPGAQGAYHAFLLVPVELIPDFDRNGVINDKDSGRTTETEPWRFWINDDDDAGAVDGNDIPGLADSDAKDSGLGTFQIDGMRDLVDFFPLHLDIKQMLEVLPPEQFSYFLKHEKAALNFAYTDLKPEGGRGERAGAYLTDLDAAQQLQSAEAFQITAPGVQLTTAFLNKIMDEGKGVILIEGRSQTDKPLVLEVRKGKEKIAELSFPVKIAPVEQMYRHKNLMAADGASGGKSDYATGMDLERLEPEDYPDSVCNEKTFLFVHGYNVNPESARGWNAEIFKRLHQAGSKAKFIGTTWNGAETQISGMEVTVNYHKNVDHAFQTAKGTGDTPGLASYLHSLGPDTVVAAHSLGNMAVASALSDWDVTINTYFMIDAAVPLEAFDLSSDPSAANPNMVHPQWLDFRKDWHASEWHKLFGPTDHRNKLTWRGRLSKLQGAIYNFYSSGEEVLADHPNTLGDPSILDIAYTNGRVYLGKYAWALQEKLKGRIHELQSFPIVGSVYGGWGFTQNFGHPPHIPSPFEAAGIARTILQNEPIFDPGYKVIEHSPGPGYPLGYTTRQMHSPSWVADLTDPTKGSETARNHLNTLLTEMFPATTAATGANKLLTIGESRNKDMQTEFKMGWPAERPDTDWRHSDIKEVAYPYVHLAFDQIVTLGNLK
jgi:hypothetical protein